MVYTVTLNPALDMFLRPESFKSGEVCRYDGGEYVPGGKGVNVSLMLQSLGVETAAAGVAAGFTGRELIRLLEEAGCGTDFVMLERGLTRVNVKILPGDGPETALNGGGMEMSLGDLEPLMERIGGLRAGDVLVLAGSVPESLPGDVYAKMMERAPLGVDVVADTSGPALFEAAKGRPLLLKPNLEELGGAFGRELRGKEDAIRYGGRLQEMGARNVAVTMGGGGALLLCEDGRVLERGAIHGREISSVGAGDSFIAGFIYGRLREGELSRALDWAAAAGAATAFCRGIAHGESVKELYSRNFLIEN